MPKPKKNESKTDFLTRCTREVVGEGKGSDQAYAMCNSYWDEAKGTRRSLSLSAPFELKASDEPDKPKGFAITAYTGNVIDMGYWGRFMFDVAGMKTKEKFPVLREHARDRVVGIGTSATKDEQNLYMFGNFTQTRDGREVVSLAEEGFPWQASVSIWPKKIKTLKDEKETAMVNGREVAGPLDIWLESKVGEVSFVALGADDQTAAIMLSDQSVPVEIVASQIINEEDHEMIDLAVLEKDAPELLAQIREAAKAEGFIEGEKEGAANELARIREVQDQVIPGHEDLIAELAFDGKTSGPEAAVKVLQAEKAIRLKAEKDIAADGIAPVEQGLAPDQNEAPDPDKELAEKARELAAKEGIPIAQALRKVAAANPQLAKAALPKFQIVNR